MVEFVQRYWRSEGYGVAVLAASGILSLLSVLVLLVSGKLKTLQKYNSAHIFSHFLILLFANSLQAVGTALNIRWVVLDAVHFTAFCGWQGAIKQLANVATAFFTLTISMHLFALLFLRINFSRLVFGLWMVLTWSLVLLLVAMGPTTIEDPNIGPFFGPSGAWCWITDDYPKSRVLLEYLIEYLAAALCFILYTAILLRVRGNLYRNDGSWSLRNLGKEEAWQLSIGRDLLDSSMLKVAKTMVWFPVAFTLTLVPISAARIPEFFGKEVPFAFTIIAAIIFNLSGFINSVILMVTSKYLPEGDSIPSFDTKRKHVSVALHKTGGLVPFTVDRSEQAESYAERRKERWGSQSSRGHPPSSLGRSGSQTSTESFQSPGAPMPRQPPPSHQRSASGQTTDSRTALIE